MVFWEMNVNVFGGLVYYVEYFDDGENFSWVVMVNILMDICNGIYYFEYYV